MKDEDMKPFEEIVCSTGYLTDRQIREALRSGYLIEKGTWDESLIRHASYMLRLGDTVHISRATIEGSATAKTFDIIRLGQHNPSLLLRLGDTALLYSMEYLRFPNTILGFTVTRGLLFAQPLVPENTYVDPGFTGSIYIVVTNLSNRAVELKYGMTIARLFFFRLAEPVESPYRTGAGVGIEQHLMTKPALDLTSLGDCRKANWEELINAIKEIPLAGNYVIEELFKRMQTRIEMLIIALVVWPLFLIFANTSEWLRQNFDSVVINILASLIASGTIWISLYIWRKFKSR
jgi:deoxycytidine triphosphate deaminase